MIILPLLKHFAEPLFQSQKLLCIGWRLVSSIIEQRPERLGNLSAERRRGGLLILPLLKHFAEPLVQSLKLLWIGWRLVSLIEQPPGLGKVLLNAHLPGLDRLILFQAGVLHLRQSCYTGWITISRVHTSLTSNCIVKNPAPIHAAGHRVEILPRAPRPLSSRVPAPGGRLSGFRRCV